MNAKLLFAALTLCVAPILASAKTPYEIAVEQKACKGSKVVSAERLDKKRIKVTCGEAQTGTDTVSSPEEVGEATNLVGLLAPLLGAGAAGLAEAASSSGSTSSTNGTN